MGFDFSFENPTNIPSSTINNNNEKICNPRYNFFVSTIFSNDILQIKKAKQILYSNKSKESDLNLKTNKTTLLDNRSNSTIEETFKKIFYDDVQSLSGISMRSSSRSNSSTESSDDYTHEFRFFNNASELRDSYYGKLITKNIMTSSKEITHNTIFIFDWDDTLFFTSYLEPNNGRLYNNLSKKEIKKVESIQYYLKLILEKALNLGHVFIVTNSSEGWVQATTKHYYPEIFPILDKVHIISARSLYEKYYPNNRQMWKMKAFSDIQEKYSFNRNILTNIICVGDSFNEIEASKLLAKKFNNVLLKTIKFREEPDLNELIKQLKLIERQMLKVYSYGKSLTIKVEKKNRNEIKENYK